MSGCFSVDCDGHNVFSVKRPRESGADALLKPYTKSEVAKVQKMSVDSGPR
jgi:hypothetical protein